MEEDGEEQLPYRAEYAKSGRSNCKFCKTSIEKGVLRLAVMVQSPVFDGKVPNWHHFDCFFKRQRPKGAADIAHLDSLRWEDQERITKALTNTPGAMLAAAASSGKKPSKKTVKSALKDFVIEYAKSSRAMCQGCELKISKGTVRISKKDYESDTAKYIGGQDRWYHIDCFAKMRVELDFFECASNVNGFSGISAEDKQMVKAALPKIDPPASSSVKSEDATDGAPSAKKVKFEKVAPESDDDARKKQNEKMFWYRDNLKQLSQKELAQLLTHNKQADASGPERKLDRLSDLMTFGALKPCEVCKNGQLVYRTGIGYQCIGDINEWTKCTNVVMEPERVPFAVPRELADRFAFLDSYHGKVQKRIFSVRQSSSSANGSTASGSTAKVQRYAPLRDLTFFVVGKTNQSKAALKKQIEDWGGTLASKLTSSVAAVISAKADPTKNEKIEQARILNINVVPVNYLEEVGKGGNAVEKITELSISSWGGDPKLAVKAVQEKSQMMKSMKSRFDIKSNKSKVTVKVKGGSAVDPDSGLENVAHVYSSGKDIWNAVLNLTDIQKNRNSYYKLQLLASDEGKTYWVWRSWGRIGTTIGGQKLEKFHSLDEAMDLFKFLYHERTNNHWEKRDKFVKYPGFMLPVDIDYGENTISMSQTSAIPSKLAKPVQDLVTMLFDVDSMKKVMMEFELDTDKMPLGKLSKSQIQKAYSVLSDLLQKTSEEIKPHAVIEATNKFYTLIPHSFGTGTVASLDNIEIIRAKLEMLESLMEMEVAYSLLRETKTEGDDSMHPLDAHYAKLNTDIDVLDRETEEFKLIEAYVKNTHGKTHSSYSLEIEDVFKVRRNGEDKRFKPFKKLHNRKLLWHGSRTTNFAGILSQGLRIAPPEAPVTGYMFGKGIYFADMVSKSANYCMTSPQNPTGLLLLCEVALGDMYERTQSDYITKLPPGKHSTKGVGANFPDPDQAKVIEDGLEIPLGRPKSKDTQGSLLYNEYIVYDVAQVKARYLIKTKFVYKLGYK